MTARIGASVAVVNGEPTAEPLPDAAVPHVLVTVAVLAPFQVYWEGVVYIGDETVALPADVADRHTLAGWVQPIA